MASTETVNTRPEDIDFLDKLVVTANAFMQLLRLENLPFVETYYSVEAKVNGIYEALRRIDPDIRRKNTINGDKSKIVIDYVSPGKLEAIKERLHQVKISIHEITTGHYVGPKELYYTIVVYRGK